MDIRRHFPGPLMRRFLAAGALATLVAGVSGCTDGANHPASAATTLSIAVLIKTSPDETSLKHGQRVTAEFVDALRTQDWEEVISLRPPAGAASVGETLRLAANAGLGYAAVGSVAPGPHGTQLRIELYAPPSSRLLWEDQITVEEGNPTELARRMRAALGG